MRIEVTKCDRCGELDSEGETVTTMAMGETQECDLCAKCAEGLERYLRGEKIARTRKPKEDD